MKINDLICQFVNGNGKGKERILGRYYASEIYSIIKGDVKPETFFERGEIDEMGSKYISEGIACEDYLIKVFTGMKVDVKFQNACEIKVNDEIVISAKTDFHFGNFIAELKRPNRLWEEIPEKWVYQLECYYRGWFLPVYLWQASYPLTIKQLEFIPSETRWKKIQKALISFHEEIKKVGEVK